MASVIDRARTAADSVVASLPSTQHGPGSTHVDPGTVMVDLWRGSISGTTVTSEGMDLSTPGVMITTDMGTLPDLLAGRLAPARAIAGIRVQIEGNADALQRLVRLFALDQSRQRGRLAATGAPLRA